MSKYGVVTLLLVGAILWMVFTNDAHANNKAITTFFKCFGFIVLVWIIGIIAVSRKG